MKSEYKHSDGKIYIRQEEGEKICDGCCFLTKAGGCKTIIKGGCSGSIFKEYKKVTP